MLSSCDVDMNVRKDRSLDELASQGNVAQFVSFCPSAESMPTQTYCRIWGYPANHGFATAEEAVRNLLRQSPERSINLRSFTPENPRSREFIYGIREIGTCMTHLHRLVNEGLYVIANETVDVSDGGVSGVIEGGVIEFAPDDTPRCVEKPGTVSLALDQGLAILKTVYGFHPELPESTGRRIEFSIHPKRRGFSRTHTLLWECEATSACNHESTLIWPNRFSRLIGDKGFGLLVADSIGMPVPQTTLISRRLRPFTFGRETGCHESWIRTCPIEQDPGRYTTANRWLDPFALLAEEDPDQVAIASILSQAAVPAQYSGATIITRDGSLHIEGTPGSGDALMLGRARPERLPDHICRDIRHLDQSLRERLGPVRFEWVHDGKRPWIVQLHKGATRSTMLTIVPGEAKEWVTFRSSEGLESLRDLLATLPAGTGVRFEGEIGLTSHIADLARKSGRPSRVIRKSRSSAKQLPLDICD